MLKRLIFFIATCLIIAGCMTPGLIVINELNNPLNDLQRICISALPLGKRIESINGREYHSEFFTTKGGEFQSAAGMATRSSAHIIILGDRRPYKIEVRVPVEKRQSNGQYELVKYDEGLARVISRRIENTLHKRRDDRNIIDDFRVF